MLKLIIFDMDGVLIDSREGWYTVFNETLEHFEHIRIDYTEFLQKVWANNFNEVAGIYFNVPIAAVRQYFEKIYDNFRQNVTAEEGTQEVLLFLKQKRLKLAVATNTHTHYAKKILQAVKLASNFDSILGADKVKNGKPDPDLLLALLTKFKVLPQEAVFIGDTVWDKMAAERAGIRFIGFRLDGDQRVDSMQELMKVL